MPTIYILLGFFSALTIGGVVAVIALRHLLHALVAVLAALLGISGIFSLCGANFIAAAQILLYAGGVSVLLAFGIMLVKRQSSDARPQSAVSNRYLAILICGLVLFGLLKEIWGQSYMPHTLVYATQNAASFALLATKGSMGKQPIPYDDTLAIGQIIVGKVFAFEALGAFLALVLVAGLYLGFNLNINNKANQEGIA